jgi:hypothetical protein
MTHRVRRANDSMILYLARESIKKFKELFPSEEPFLKIICLRDRRLVESFKSGNPSWRKLEITQGGETKSIILNDPSEDVAIVKTHSKEFKKEGINKTESINRGSRSNRRARHETTGKVIKTSEPDLTYTERVETREVPINEVDVLMQSEIICDPLDTRLDYIHVSKHSFNIDEISCSLKPLEGVFIQSVSTLGEAFSRLESTINNYKSLVSSIDANKEQLGHDESTILGLRAQVKTLSHTVIEGKMMIESLQMSKDKLSESKIDISKIQQRLGTTNSAEELANKYVMLQEKLNVIKKSLNKYTKVDELGWTNLIKQHGFILAIPYLVDFWYDQAEQSPGDEDIYEYDDE